MFFINVKAINETAKSDHQSVRIKSLRENIRLNIYLWVTSGMFERDNAAETVRAATISGEFSESKDKSVEIT